MAIGHGPQVAQGDEPVAIRLEKNDTELKAMSGKKRKNESEGSPTKLRKVVDDHETSGKTASGYGLVEVINFDNSVCDSEVERNALHQVVVDNTLAEISYEVPAHDITQSLPLVPYHEEVGVADPHVSGHVVPQLEIGSAVALGPVQSSSSVTNYSSYAVYQHQKHVAAPSKFHATLTATGTMLGNIAKGLMEGASPIINNIMLMQQVIYIFKHYGSLLFT